MSKTIRGISVRIGADTSGLQKALKDVNQRSRDIRSELRKVQRGLKFNPDSTELLNQKQKLLAERVENTRDKLDKLRQAQSQVKRQFEKGEIDEGQYRAFRREIITTRSKLNTFENQLESTNRDTSEFKRRLADAREQMGKMARRAAVGLAAASAAVGAAVAQATKHTMEYTKEVDNAAKAANVGAEGFQELRFALGQVGIESDDVKESLIEVNRIMGEAQQGDTKMQQRLQSVGLSMEEIKNLNADEAFMKIVNGLSEMDSQAKKTALAGQLLGEDVSMKLLPAIEDGAEGIDKLRERAHELGIVVSDETVAAGVELTDTYDEMQKAFEGIQRQIATKLMPKMQDWSDYTLDNMPKIREKIDEVYEAMEDVAYSFKLMYDVGKIAFEGVADLIVATITPFRLVKDALDVMVLGFNYSLERAKLPVAEFVDYTLDKLSMLEGIPGIGDKFKDLADNAEVASDNIKKNIADLESKIKKNNSDMKISLTATGIAFSDLGKNFKDNIDLIIKDFNKLAYGNTEAQENIQENNDETTENVEENQETQSQLTEDHLAYQAKIRKKMREKMEKGRLAVVEAIKKANKEEKEAEKDKAEFIDKQNNYIMKKLAEGRLLNTKLTKEELKKRQDKYKKAMEAMHKGRILATKLTKKELQKRENANNKARAAMHAGRIKATELMKVELQKRATAFKTAINKRYSDYQRLMEAQKVLNTNFYNLASQNVKNYFSQLQQKFADSQQSVKLFSQIAANKMVNFFDSISSGAKTFKETMKDAVISIITMLEKQVIAQKLAGIAYSWANAPLTFGASLAYIGKIIASTAPALAAFEGAKSVIRGLETGGVVTAPTLSMVGEGRDNEAVIPLNREVLSNLGNQIAQHTSNSGSKKEIHQHIHIDRAQPMSASEIAKKGDQQLKKLGVEWGLQT